MTSVVDSGDRYGRLSFVRQVPRRANDKHLRGLWRCECGSEKEIAISRVRKGYSKSCGCLAAEVSSEKARKHGMRGTPEYSSWQAMKARCLDPNNKDYPRWGGRGVTVCAEWVASFDAFYEHIGPRLPRTSLDRINNTRGYEPGNVRWATAKEQQENRRDSWEVEIDGVRFESVKAAADHHSVSETTIVRWCDGYVDIRRTHQTGGGIITPRKNCRRWRKYAPENH
jgi:hypothetical protein